MMTWSGDYSQCIGCHEVYPYATDKCPCCHNVCRTYVSVECKDFGSGRHFELIGEQKKVVKLPPRGPVLIKGGAGSGKTLVSVKRAEYLTNNYSDMFQRSKVAIFAYNKELVLEIQKLVSDQTIRVFNIDSWVYRLLADNHRRLGLIKESDLRECRAAAKQAAFSAASTKAIAKKSDEFYATEIRWLKGRRISTLEEYKRTKRTGLGTADHVTSSDRELLWKMFVEYNRLLSKRGIRDWEDRVLDALEIVEGEGFVPPYTHIVIDEAQDFTFAKIALIRRLVSPSTESLTIVADSAQRIYQSGFSWADLGIRVVGRSVEFKRNYRNTKQISEAAYSLMSHEKECDDFTRMESAQLEGRFPLLVKGPEKACEKHLVDAVKNLPLKEDSVIALPTHKMMQQMESLLNAAGIRVSKTVADSKQGGCVRLSTYHALKGLQFTHVFLWAATKWHFPINPMDEEETSKLRKLLYVAMTRATRTLSIYGMSDTTGFMQEIDSVKIEVVNLGVLSVIELE